MTIQRRFTTILKMFLEAARAKRLSVNTLNDYQNTYKKFICFTGGDMRFDKITPELITRFMDVIGGKVSPKTALNYHTGLSSLWRFAARRGYCSQNIIRQVEPPRPQASEIIPFTREEVTRIIQATQEGLNKLRDHAIILMLLDTGVRASELCQAKIMDTSLTGCSLRVHGKGAKDRLVKFSLRTGGVTLAYLTERGVRIQRRYWRLRLFVTDDGELMDRHTLRQLMERLGERSGVVRVHAHRFRHTFAITFLRNGGNIYTLQKILGHTTLEMVKRYLQIAQIDIDRDHEKASPVTNWGL